MDEVCETPAPVFGISTGSITLSRLADLVSVDSKVVIVEVLEVLFSDSSLSVVAAAGVVLGVEVVATI